MLYWVPGGRSKVRRSEARNEKKTRFIIVLFTATGNWMLDPRGQFKESCERNIRIFSMEEKEENIYALPPIPISQRTPPIGWHAPQISGLSISGY